MVNLGIDIKEAFDPNTYELTVVVTEFDHKTIRSGNWIYYTKGGILKLEENYPGNSNGSVYHDYLCISQKEKSRERAKNLSDPFILFNSISQKFGLNYWLNEDDFLNSTNYYLNGRIIADVQIKNHPNNKEVINIKSPKTDIKIDIKTNDYAALGKKEKERKVIFNANISRVDGKGDIISYTGDKIKRFQTQNNVKSGLYEERTCDGSLLVEGKYCHIKSFQRDTIVVFNPDTYQEEIQIVESDFIEKRVGTWKFYDNNGILEREEDFGNCN